MEAVSEHRQIAASACEISHSPVKDYENHIQARFAAFETHVAYLPRGWTGSDRDSRSTAAAHVGRDRRRAQDRSTLSGTGRRNSFLRKIRRNTDSRTREGRNQRFLHLLDG